MPQPIDQTLSDVSTRLEVEIFAQIQQARYRDPQNFSMNCHDLLQRLFEAHHHYPQYFPAIQRRRIGRIRNDYHRYPQEVLRYLFGRCDMRPNSMTFEKEAEKMKPSKRYVVEGGSGRSLL